MKKLLSVCIVLIILLMLSVPGFMGWQTEKTMHNMVSQINELPEYKAHWQSYQRGWFASRGVLLLELPRLAELSVDQQSVSLPVEFDLQHGPILFKNGLKLGWFALDVLLNDEQEQYLKNLVQVEQSGPFYHLSASMNMLGETTFNDRWLPFTYRSSSLVLTTESLVGQGRIGIDQHLKYAFTLPRMTMLLKSEKADKNVDIKDVASSLMVDFSQLHQANIAPGSVNFSVGSLVAPSIFSLNNFKVDALTELNQAKTLFSSTTQLSAAQFQWLAGATPVVFNQLNIDMAYSNIAVQFIERYQALMAAAGDNKGADFYQQNVGALVLSDLLPHSPKLALNNIGFSSDLGRLDVQAHLTVDGAAMASANLNPQNPLGLVPYLIFAVNANGDKAQVLSLLQYYMTQQITSAGGIADKATVQNNAQVMLDGLVAQSFVSVAQDKVSFNFNLEKGQAVLNNKPFPLPF